jgi:uncharacterized protein (TIGR00255 family)
LLVSMTGFGAGLASDDKRRTARVEARSVNHRYLDVVLHFSRRHVEWEDRTRRLVNDRLARGRVEIFATLEECDTEARNVRLDRGLLAGYSRAVGEAEKVVGPLSFSLPALLSIPDLFVIEDNPDDVESTWPVLAQAIEQALDDLLEMRVSEGLRLQDDMLRRLEQVEVWLGDIASKVPGMVEEYRGRLASRIAELVSSPPVAEERIAAEVALFADRSCVTEELVRATSHIAHFRQACAGSGQVGRKLDFLLQELNREANTIASKVADSEIAQLVVSVKAELEKIREQVQNIE